MNKSISEIKHIWNYIFPRFSKLKHNIRFNEKTILPSTKTASVQCFSIQTDLMKTWLNLLKHAHFLIQIFRIKSERIWTSKSNIDELCAWILFSALLAELKQTQRNKEKETHEKYIFK